MQKISASDVFLHEHQVIKIVRTPEEFEQERLNLLEVQGLAPSIISYLGSSENIPNSLIFEHCDLGNALEHFAQFGQSYFSIPFVIREILLALHALHGLQLVHGDIKPENILLTSRHDVKLCDFAFLQRRGRCDKLRGTVGFFAPELIHGNVSPAADMWSIGCTMYSLYTGRMPFGHKNLREYLSRVKLNNVNFVGIDPCTRDFICRCLNPAATRMSAAQALNHPALVQRMN